MIAADPIDLYHGTNSPAWLFARSRSTRLTTLLRPAGKFSDRHVKRLSDRDYRGPSRVAAAAFDLRQVGDADSSGLGEGLLLHLLLLPQRFDRGAEGGVRTAGRAHGRDAFTRESVPPMSPPR